MNVTIPGFIRFQSDCECVSIYYGHANLEIMTETMCL